MQGVLGIALVSAIITIHFFTCSSLFAQYVLPNSQPAFQTAPQQQAFGQQQTFPSQALSSQPLPQQTFPQQQNQVTIRQESRSLQESNPVFDGFMNEAAQAVNNGTAPQVQTFQAANTVMIPSGIQQTNPLDSKNEFQQFQSAGQVPLNAGSSNNTITGNTATGTYQLGAFSEKPLTETSSNDTLLAEITPMAQQMMQQDNATLADKNPNSSPNPLNAYEKENEKYSGSRQIGLLEKSGEDEENMEGMPVLEVMIEGNGQVPKHTIQNKIKTMAGYPYHRQTVQEDVRTLNQTGSFIAVNAKKQRKQNGVVVIFELFERPIFHTVRFIGCKAITRRRLSEEAGIKAGDPVDKMAVLQAKEKIIAMYKEEGFENTHVEIASGDRPDDRNAVFVINEGNKPRVLSVEFVGAQFVSASRLKTQIESKPGYFYYIGGNFSREKLDRDVDTLLNYYRRFGFFNAKIDREFEETNGYTGTGQPDSWIKVRFIITEGPRYKIGDVRFVGNKLFTTAELNKAVKLTSGKDFLQDTLQLDKNAISEKYGMKSYLFAKVTENVRYLAEKPNVVDIVYEIEEGKPTRIVDIDVKFDGPESHTKTTVILDRLLIKPGSNATSDQMRRTERLLRTSGSLNSDPTQGKLPTVSIMPVDDLGNELLPDDSDNAERGDADKELNEIDSVTRGQSPDEGYTVYRAQSNDAYSQPAQSYQQTQPQHYQYVPANSPADISLTSPGSGLSNGYNGSASTGYPASGYPSSATSPYQSGTVPNLSVSTSSGSSMPSLMPMFGFAGANETPANNVPSGNTPSDAAPFAGYLGGGSNVPANIDYNTTLPAGGNPQNNVGSVVPAINNGGYFGDLPYGSISQAGSTMPPGSAYAPTGAPGSVTRNTDDYFGFARGRAVVSVQEGRTGIVRMGVGVNSDSGLTGNFSIEERNFDWRRWPTNPFSFAGWRNAFRGGGQRFLLEAIPGENVQRYQVSFTEPYLFHTKYSLTLNGFYYTRYYEEWREHRTGGGVTLGRAWTDHFSTGISFNGTSIKIYDPIYPTPKDLTKALGTNGQYAFGLNATYDTRDDIYMPTKGFTISGNVEQVLGTSRFLRGGYDARTYMPLYHRPDMSGAWVLGLRSAANVTEKSTPIYERYYAGGFSTIRGYEYRGVTPRENDVGIGGNFEFYNSIELCFPITADDRVRGVFFVDSGTVQESISNWKYRYRVAPGFGVRLCIPMMGPVPIAFDFAFPINSERGDREQVFLFNMSYMR
ncbi:MAG: BamA/TamA family outer membrane protein [Planctomycetaceae bacterium]|nr:BamA/TamA family outer membrane protein [Planctomycetaceae bacterium]